jgi:hypothetical protein
MSRRKICFEIVRFLIRIVELEVDGFCKLVIWRIVNKQSEVAHEDIPSLLPAISGISKEWLVYFSLTEDDYRGMVPQPLNVLFCFDLH